MTLLAPHLTAFFQERLAVERRASLNTCDSYAYAFKLLLNFAGKRLKIAPCRIGIFSVRPRLAGLGIRRRDDARDPGTIGCPAAAAMRHHSMRHSITRRQVAETTFFTPKRMVSCLKRGGG